MDLAAIDALVDRVEPGGTVEAIRRLTGGVSADVFGVNVTTTDGRSRQVVVRRHRTEGFKGHDAGVTAKEHGVLARLHAAGLPVPEPYLLEPPAMVLEWVDGTTEVGGALDGALDQMAAFLVDLHRLDTATLDGVPGLAPIEDARSAIGPHLPATPAGEAVAATLARTGGGAPTAAPTVLLHGDYWPGNVLWRDGRLVAVVDWEDACLGDPLADLATVRVELLCRYGEQAMERFTQRYLNLAGDRTGGSGRIGREERLVLWELYVSATALASMSEWGLPPAEEAERRRRTTAFFERAAADL